MKALLLAAGYATRLWPLTLNKPKPLLNVKRKPIIEYSIEKIKNLSKLSRIYVVTNTKFVKNFKTWASTCKTNTKISIIDDKMKTVKQRRGSVGDILYSINNKKIKDDLLIIAGDNLFNFPLDNFMEFCVAHKPNVTIGLFDVKNKTLAKQYGIVALNKKGRITNFLEKPKKPPSTLAAMCLYYIPANKLKLVKNYKDEGLPLDLAGNFIKWLSKKESVFGYIFNGVWLDIGDKKSLKYARKNYQER
jgi:glucose-1-phosphate thymidylyltransferase